MRRKSVDSTVKEFAKKLRVKFKPVKIILFGSRASGEAWHYSDYDFIIVSDIFKKFHWLERISKVVKCWDSDRAIDVLPYTPNEFESKSRTSSVVREAVKKGVEV